jgi:cysteine desulfurase
MSAQEPTSKRIYLDYNATSPLAPGVEEAVVDALRLPGNPSSPHEEGRDARRLLEQARHHVAEALGAEALDLVFTSGGTEANHLGLIGLARSTPGRRVLLPPTLHPSLAAAASQLADEGFAVDTLAVDPRGQILLGEARTELESGDVSVLAFTLANHETGVIEEVSALSELGRSQGALVFCDAVQAVGRVPLDVKELGLDGISISAHKIGGPKGVGALWIKPGPDLRPLVGGGKQEGGRRPGTQACGLIAGFGAAAAALESRLKDAPRQSILRGRAEEGLLALGAQIHSGEDGLCNTVSARFPGVPGDLLVTSLDLVGIAISTGAACSSGTTEASANLLGIGLSEEQALESFRVSLGMATQASDIDLLLEVLPSILERARQFS